MQRAACDNCHKAKSRCSKESERCNRCKRLELACTYSSPLRMGRPSYRKADEERSFLIRETSQHDARQSKRVSDVPTLIDPSQSEEILPDSLSGQAAFRFCFWT